MLYLLHNLCFGEHYFWAALLCNGQSLCCESYWIGPWSVTLYDYTTAMKLLGLYFVSPNLVLCSSCIVCLIGYDGL